MSGLSLTVADLLDNVRQRAQEGGHDMADEDKAKVKAATANEQAILAKLAELGGSRFDDDSIVSEGERIVIPRTMTMKQAVRFLNGRIQADEEFVQVKRTFRYRPWDGAVCTYRALKRTFGMVGHEGTMGFFGPNPPSFIDVRVGPNDIVQAPWGQLTLPLLPDAAFELGAEPSDMGLLFRIVVSTPRKWKSHVEGVLSLIDKELQEHSIYRGKAFDGREMPEFLDLSGVNPDKVVYSTDTAIQLDANIWSVMRHADQLREAGISLKRSALLHGPYGTGKTLTGFRTALVAVENGWTLIYARPGQDDLEDVMRTAQLYQPACVFAEDLDVAADSGQVSADQAARLLDIFDGITSKGTELLVVLTTNHPERIHKGMLRPGRLDAVIEVAELDKAGVIRLIQTSVPATSLGDVNWDDVGQAMDGMLPSYVKEAADRAFRYALARVDGELAQVRLSTDDFVNSAEGLRPQLLLMEGAKERTAADSLGVQMGKLMQEQLVKTVVDQVIKDEVKAELDGKGTR